jgi:hypothetical protein
MLGLMYTFFSELYAQGTDISLKIRHPGSVANPGCFISDPDPNISHPESENFVTRILHEKWGTFLLASYGFRSKVLVIVIVVNKIRDPEKIPGSR